MAVIAYKTGVKSDSIVFDATVSETHSFSTQVSENPVEKGADVTDHVRAKPAVVKLECYATDNPLSSNRKKDEKTSIFLGSPKEETGRGLNVFLALEQLKDNGTVCQLFTGLKKYENMVIEEITVPRDSSISRGFKFTISLREVVIVQSQTVQVQKPKKKSAQKKVVAGAQNTKPTEDKTAEKKIAKSYLKSLLGA